MAAKDKAGEGFSAAEKKAMKEHAAELRAQKAAQRSADKAAVLEKQLLDAITAMPEPDRGLAKKIHEIVKKTAPDLQGKTWYGMPAYANNDGKIVVFFQAASKFGVRYATLGFNEDAQLDDGTMWPTSFAMTALSKADEQRVVELIKRAIS